MAEGRIFLMSTVIFFFFHENLEIILQDKEHRNVSLIKEFLKIKTLFFPWDLHTGNSKL